MLQRCRFLPVGRHCARQFETTAAEFSTLCFRGSGASEDAHAYPETTCRYLEAAVQSQAGRGRPPDCRHTANLGVA